MNRTARAAMAQETLAIVEQGRYDLGDGKIVSIADEVRSCVDGTELLRPDDLARIQDEVLSQPGQSGGVAIEVVNETTLAGVSRLLLDQSAPVAALNFASAKNPGGGFLSGSQAQEESLARSSALHASLMNAWDFYEQHRQGSSSLYSDSMIWSPGCPVFRDDAGTLLDRIQLATFITAAAPNAGAVKANEPENEDRIPGVLAGRAEYVLALASSRGYRRLVLGAWGCGVFRNDPQTVADVFMTLLGSPRWANRFSRVVFSILDPSPDQHLIKVFKAAAVRGR
ncbi:MAG TPA: TIGR02452 family protein [Steroidobacter sp.]